MQAVPGVSYQGAKLVQESVAINHPVIYVSANYRLNSFGFSASDDFAKAGLLNIGIKDQRTAMRWIQKYIAKVR
jgi:acetylcholinesterase